jgi:hypothetical protein
MDFEERRLKAIVVDQAGRLVGTFGRITAARGKMGQLSAATFEAAPDNAAVISVVTASHRTSHYDWRILRETLQAASLNLVIVPDDHCLPMSKVDPSTAARAIRRALLVLHP